MNENSPSFKQVCARYLDYICLNTSCHGGNWAMKITSTKLKIFFQFWIIFFSGCMVGAIILRFLSPEQPITILHWKENDGSFPNITLCSNRIFDMAKVQGLLLTKSFFPQRRLHVSTRSMRNILRCKISLGPKGAFRLTSSWKIFPIVHMETLPKISYFEVADFVMLPSLGDWTSYRQSPWELPTVWAQDVFNRRFCSF